MKKIAVIGGGTGSFTVLRGLKKYDLQLSAIVSMFDSGGSTGKLRDEFGILPTGDVRRCLLALADEKSENVMRQLFLYRFSKDCSLHGHSFGNLFLTALTEITGNEEQAIKKAGRVLNVKGRVYPVTFGDAHLCAKLEDGRIIRGETNIDVPKHNGDLRIHEIYLEPLVNISESANKTVREADYIVIGPGDLYTSIIPNFLVQGMRDALQESKAKLLYVVNTMTKWGETNGYNVSDFVREIEKYSGKSLDYILCNNAIGSVNRVKKYEEENAFPVVVDIQDERVIQADLIGDSTFLRHDPEKLGLAIKKIVHDNNYDKNVSN